MKTTVTIWKCDACDKEVNSPGTTIPYNINWISAKINGCENIFHVCDDCYPNTTPENKAKLFKQFYNACFK